MHIRAYYADNDRACEVRPNECDRVHRSAALRVDLLIDVVIDKRRVDFLGEAIKGALNQVNGPHMSMALPGQEVSQRRQQYQHDNYQSDKEANVRLVSYALRHHYWT